MTDTLISPSPETAARSRDFHQALTSPFSSETIDASSRHEESPLAVSNWIWLAESPVSSDQYVCFRRTFHIETTNKDAHLIISADSDFVVWLNGHEIGRGQFSDFATSKTWSRFSLSEALLLGENLIAVLVYHRGEDFLDHQAGHPGMILTLRSETTEIVTDQNWKATQHPAYRSGTAERMTSQCGFTFEYDARAEQPWLTTAYDDSDWPQAGIVQYQGIGDIWHELSPRPLPCLILGELSPLRIVSQGSYIQTRTSQITAESMMLAALCGEVFPWLVFENESLETGSSYSEPRRNAGSFLSEHASEPLVIRAPAANFDGQYFIVDLGRETVGLIEFEIEASAGTTIEIGHGEHLDDGRVRVFVGGRNFADRYICGAGHSHFQMPFRRVGARYLQIHCTGAVKFHRLGLRTVSVGNVTHSAFKTHDPLANQIHEIALRTLDLCRHEHYEDCPWREQALYGYDGRLQALYGYYAFGDYRFSKVSFTLLGKSLDQRGFLQLTAPGRWNTTIPIFTFAWISAVGEHWLYSGDPSLFETFRLDIETILGKAFSDFDAETGLYHVPEGQSLWHFYEWTPGLTGVPEIEHQSPTAHEAGYNLYLHEAARHHARMLRLAGHIGAAQMLEQRLATLKIAIHRQFWDPVTGYYRSILDGGAHEGAHELIQILALSEGVVPLECKDSVIQALFDGRTRTCMLSAFYYRIRALADHSHESRLWMDSSLEEIWQHMALSGATTLWETAQGSEDFYFAGSLCHGWSALPIYYHQAIVLGVQPISPGFRSFSVRIFPSRFSWAEGSIPTPFGDIDISWRKADAGLVIEATGPTECSPLLQDYPEAPVASAIYNGKPLILS